MGVPLQQIVELWQTPLPITEVARKVGLSRQRVSQRLIEAGYDPASRRAETLAQAAHTTAEFRAQRIESVKAKAAQRERVMDEFDALAREHHVQPWTLAQYVNRDGTYGTIRTGTSKHAGRYGSGKLPPRGSAEALPIVRAATSICDPWSVRRIGELCSRRVRARA